MKKNKMIIVTPVLPVAPFRRLLKAAKAAGCSTDRYAGRQIVTALAAFKKEIPLGLLGNAAAVSDVKSALAKIKVQLTFDDSADGAEAPPGEYQEVSAEYLAAAELKVFDELDRESSKLVDLLDAVHANLAALSGEPAPGALEKLHGDASDAADYSLDAGLTNEVSPEALPLARLLVALGTVADPNFK